MLTNFINLNFDRFINNIYINLKKLKKDMSNFRYKFNYEILKKIFN